MVDYIKFTPEMSNNWSRTIRWAENHQPWHSKRIVDASTVSQLESKLWLATELAKFKDEVNDVALLGGWFAHIIVPLLVDEIEVKNIYNYDICRDSLMLSYKFNRRYKHDIYHVRTKNIMINWISKDHKPDTIINTSCEHMFPMWRFRELNSELNPERHLYVLQSTDDDQYDDHINCVSGPDELAEQAKLNDVYYSGSLTLDNGMTRFMVIGR